MIKEHFSKIQRGECSKTELVLTGICMVFFGIILGMKFSPARIATLGCFNGNTGWVDNPEILNKKQDKDA